MRTARVWGLRMCCSTNCTKNGSGEGRTWLTNLVERLTRSGRRLDYGRSSTVIACRCHCYTADNDAARTVGYDEETRRRQCFANDGAIDIKNRPVNGSAMLTMETEMDGLRMMRVFYGGCRTERRWRQRRLKRLGFSPVRLRFHQLEWMKCTTPHVLLNNKNNNITIIFIYLSSIKNPLNLHFIFFLTFPKIKSTLLSPQPINHLSLQNK